VQINVICPQCHCSMNTHNLCDVAIWFDQHRCMPIDELVIEGNLDLVTLQEALKL
jgi:hypothetical protein